MLTQPYHDPTGDEMEHQMFCLIADKIESEPSLLEIPLANVDRWLAKGHNARQPLLKWRELICEARTSPAGMEKLLGILRDDSEESRFFKGFEPFPGILDDGEIDRLSWTSRH
jgi:hypothetical protein